MKAELSFIYLREMKSDNSPFEARIFSIVLHFLVQLIVFTTTAMMLVKANEHDFSANPSLKDCLLVFSELPPPSPTDYLSYHYCPPLCLKFYKQSLSLPLELDVLVPISGSLPYLRNSSVCFSAIHAGIYADELGGIVMFFPHLPANWKNRTFFPTNDSALSSTRNGVISKSVPELFANSSIDAVSSVYGFTRPGRGFLQNQMAPFSPRSGATVFPILKRYFIPVNGNITQVDRRGIMLIGGKNGTTYFNDVWLYGDLLDTTDTNISTCTLSASFQQWTLMTAAASFSPRAFASGNMWHRYLTNNDSTIILIGGETSKICGDLSVCAGDWYRSEDYGRSWKLIGQLSYSPRCEPTVNFFHFEVANDPCQFLNYNLSAIRGPTSNFQYVDSLSRLYTYQLCYSMTNSACSYGSNWMPSLCRSGPATGTWQITSAHEMIVNRNWTILFDNSTTNPNQTTILQYTMSKGAASECGRPYFVTVQFKCSPSATAGKAFIESLRSNSVDCYIFIVIRTSVLCVLPDWSRDRRANVRAMTGSTEIAVFGGENSAVLNSDGSCPVSLTALKETWWVYAHQDLETLEFRRSADFDVVARVGTTSTVLMINPYYSTFDADPNVMLGEYAAIQISGGAIYSYTSVNSSLTLRSVSVIFSDIQQCMKRCRASYRSRIDRVFDYTCDYTDFVFTGPQTIPNQVFAIPAIASLPFPVAHANPHSFASRQIRNDDNSDIYSSLYRTHVYGGVSSFKAQSDWYSLSRYDMSISSSRPDNLNPDHHRAAVIANLGRRYLPESDIWTGWTLDNTRYSLPLSYLVNVTTNNASSDYGYWDGTNNLQITYESGSEMEFQLISAVQDQILLSNGRVRSPAWNVSLSATSQVYASLEQSPLSIFPPRHSHSAAPPLCQWNSDPSFPILSTVPDWVIAGQSGFNYLNDVVTSYLTPCALPGDPQYAGILGSGSSSNCGSSRYNSSSFASRTALTRSIHSTCEWHCKPGWNLLNRNKELTSIQLSCSANGLWVHKYTTQ